MTKVNIKYKNNIIDSLTITGHTGYSEIGSDIVCATISSMVTTTVNAIIKLDSKSINYDVKEAFTSINIIKHTHEVDILMENLVSLLNELSNQYKNYIEIK